jgi:acetamidase/formamidase
MGVLIPKGVSALGTSPRFPRNSQLAGTDEAAAQAVGSAPALMTAKRLTEDEAISLMSVAVDFGVTQVADGNWGIHAILKKALFSGEAG